VFNEDLLTQCNEPKFKGQHKELAPPPNIVNKKEEYEVEEIRKCRKQDRGMQYQGDVTRYDDHHTRIQSQLQISYDIAER